MEEANSRRFGALGRGGQLRHTPAAVRRIGSCGRLPLRRVGLSDGTAASQRLTLQ